MATVTGERVFNTKGQTPKRDSIPPLQPGTYTLKLDTSSAEVGKNEAPGKMPYVKCRFELVGHDWNSGKKRYLTVWFLTSMKETKNGVQMPTKADQILGFAKAAGVDLTCGFVEVPDGEGGTVTCLNAQEILAYLKGLDGKEVKARLKIDRQKDRDPENRIEQFIPSEDGAVDFGG